MKLLVVEAHEDTLNALGKILRRHGYEVHTATTRERALSLAEIYTFDLAIVDHGMPGEDGCEIMGKLFCIQQMRGIALTTRDQRMDIARSKKIGFLAHLTKPVSTQELCETIEAVLGSDANASLPGAFR